MRQFCIVPFTLADLICDVVDLNRSPLWLAAPRGCSSAYHLLKWGECVAESTIWGRESPIFSAAARAIGHSRGAHVSVAFLRAGVPRISASPQRSASTINQSPPTSDSPNFRQRRTNTSGTLSAIVVDERFR